MGNNTTRIYNIKMDREGELMCDEDGCIQHGVGTRSCPLDEVETVGISDDQYTHTEKPWKDNE